MKSGFWQLIGHEHSLRIRHHRHTSYAGLIFVLLLIGILLLGVSYSASAAPPAVNPQSGSVGLTGTVRGPAPSQAATIGSPRNGQHTSSVPITVTGSCPTSTFVLVTKNAVFAGATDCKDDGTYSLQIDLFAGQNLLVARISDALGQFGPDSAAVTIFYDAAVLATPNSVGKQLFIQADTTVTAVSPGQSLTRFVTLVGGSGPYAVSWDWGDGATSLSSQPSEGTVSGSHTYDRAGNYRVVVKVSDAQGNAAFLQLVTVVNGPITAVGASNSNGKGALPGSLLTAWPLYLLAIFMVSFFWLGERRELRLLRKQGKLAS